MYTGKISIDYPAQGDTYNTYLSVPGRVHVLVAVHQAFLIPKTTMVSIPPTAPPRAPGIKIVNRNGFFFR